MTSLAENGNRHAPVHNIADAHHREKMSFRNQKPPPAFTNGGFRSILVEGVGPPANNLYVPQIVGGSITCRPPWGLRGGRAAVCSGESKRQFMSQEY